MVLVLITEDLEKEINKKFKKESIKIFELMYSLKDNPKKGKPLARVGKIIIKELRYKSFRFYFIVDNLKLKLLKADELKYLLIKFVRMSDKKSQQRTIDEIKRVLRGLGDEGF